MTREYIEANVREVKWLPSNLSFPEVILGKTAILLIGTYWVPLLKKA